MLEDNHHNKGIQVSLKLDPTGSGELLSKRLGTILPTKNLGSEKFTGKLKQFLNPNPNMSRKVRKMCLMFLKATSF